MQRTRYTLSAFEYDEDTGHAKAMGYYKQEDLLTEARHTAQNMLDLEPSATYVTIYEGAKVLETVTRKSAN